MHLVWPPPSGSVNQSAPISEPKGQISHSTVEKQRRDRINSLIDEVCVARGSDYGTSMSCRVSYVLPGSQELSIFGTYSGY